MEWTNKNDAVRLACYRPQQQGSKSFPFLLDQTNNKQQTSLVSDLNYLLSGQIIQRSNDDVWQYHHI